MAKLKAPLLSLGASGAIGHTLVFFPWKGINAVREYVIPANPNTDPQDKQRDYVTKGVAKVHTAMARADHALNSADQIAYSALASAKGKIMTWFNQAVKLWIDVKVDAKTPIVYSDGLMLNPDKDDFRPQLFLNEEEGSDLTVGKFYLGTTKTNLVHSEDANVIAGHSVSLIADAGFSGLTSGTKYFWQFRPTADPKCEGADSGIYYAVAT